MIYYAFLIFGVSAADYVIVQLCICGQNYLLSVHIYLRSLHFHEFLPF